MRIASIGGGPGGLYFAILMKKLDPSIDITVFDRNPPGETWGWGVVFSDETLEYLADNDPPTHQKITAEFAHWDSIDVHYKDEVVRSSGHGFSGVSRHTLIRILRDRALELGVTLTDRTEIEALPAGFDLYVAADGLNSKLRNAHLDVFKPTLEKRSCKFIWLGTPKIFTAFTFIFEPFADGFFQVHAYPFSKDRSTFIVETDPATWEAAGLSTMDEPAQLAFLEKMFEKYLGGEKLLSNKSAWIHFHTLKCKTWSHGNIALVGDSAHTAHFSIGSGTKMAMEDSISLAKALAAHKNDIPAALVAYEAERRPIVERTQAAAQDSLLFFEHVKRYKSFDPLAFTTRLMTRSKRIGFENLTVRDPALMTKVRDAFAKTAAGNGSPVTAGKSPAPPMFQKITARGLTLENRVVVSPMCMYSATNGAPDEFHLVHYGSRAIGGAGLLITEMTNVSAEGRITPGCTGMYSDEHVAAWKKITDFVHARSRTKIGIQLGHAGRKGSTRVPWEAQDAPLLSGNWELMAPSALAYSDKNQVPRAMTRADMDRVKAEHVAAVKRSIDAGFDWLELHMAHGYLLATFLSPLTNVRTDEYGGSLAARLRYPLEVFDAVREAWPKDRPMSVRLSATDWADGGLTGEDSVEIARVLKEHGADFIDVSTGQTVPHGRPAFYGRMFQTPFADQIRNEVGIRTMAVGNITTADQVNTILAAGRADLVVLARGHLRDPYFTMHAAEEAGVADFAWPAPYGLVRPMTKSG
jgi:anthraniloyl-CoA monooxygenase